MAGTSATRRDVRVVGLVVCIALLGAIVSPAEAQPCNGPLPAIGKPNPLPANEKFKLIAQQCSVLEQPMNLQRAAQLDLYPRNGAVSVSIHADVDLPAPSAEAAASPPLTSAPPSRDAARVISLAPALTEAARINQIDPLLLHAIAHVESRHNAQAVSPAGARGAMQVMPATARRFGVTDPERSLHDPETNLRASAALLRTLRERYGDDLRLVLAAYNAGEGAVEKYGRAVPPFPETQAYVKNVLAVYRRLSSEFVVSDAGALVARGARQ